MSNGILISRIILPEQFLKFSFDFFDYWRSFIDQGCVELNKTSTGPDFLIRLLTRTHSPHPDDRNRTCVKKALYQGIDSLIVLIKTSSFPVNNQTEKIEKAFSLDYSTTGITKSVADLPVLKVHLLYLQLISKAFEGNLHNNLPVHLNPKSFQYQEWSLMCKIYSYPFI